MPYSISNPPTVVKGLPKHAIEIFVAAFNAAFAEYNGDEGKSMATAWAAVYTKFKKNEQGEWVTKEGKMQESELSAEDTRRLLQGALEQQFPSGIVPSMPGGAWIRDIYETELVYEHSGQAYKVPYSINDGKVTFGKSVKVMAATVYSPIESVRHKHAEIIQEAGRRNANLARIQKIVDLCQGTLSSEVEESKVQEALKEAEATMVWLKEQAVMKTEDGVKFPAEAYAYVPDPEKPSEWKLRIWEDPEKKVTRAQLGRAAAALSPGGFRGQKVGIPAGDLSAVKRKIRAEYRKLDVADEEIPRWVKESETRNLLLNYIPLSETTVDTKGIARVVIIKPGFGNPVDNYYYPAETLARDFGVFEGLKMYADHQTPSEEKERPEGSIRQWVASLKNVRFEEGVGIVGDAIIIEPWLQAKLAMLRDKNLLSEMGISIKAVGIGTKGKAEGRDANIVERITRARSVDFVTEAGAGGVVTMYEADRDSDIDIVTLEVLRERRPDLVKTIETEVKAVMQKEVKHMMEQEEKIKGLEGQVVTLTTERDELKAKITEADKAKAKAEAQAIIKEAVAKAVLPDAAKERILARFVDAESIDGLEEAIKGEAAYVAKLLETGKVRGLGPTQPEIQASHEALVGSFKRLGMTQEQAEIAARGR